MARPGKIDDVPRRIWRITADTPQGELVDALRADDRIPPSIRVEFVEASWVGSSWDLLTGLDVVETEPDHLFDEFFDSESGGVRERPSSGELGKDQWVLAFAVELAELDRDLDPSEVIRLAKTLWRKKGHLAATAVAQDAFSTGWLLRATRESERS
jgi:hypothetical protein